MGGELTEVLVEFHPHGSLATTHESQGSDMGLFGGLLGWEATDERLARSSAAIREAGIEVKMAITAYGAEHPNTYRMTLSNAAESHRMTAISTGGGMIEVIEVDGIKVSMGGDYYETLIYAGSNGRALREFLMGRVEADEILLLGSAEGQLVEVKGQRFLEEALVAELCAAFDVRQVKTLSPVLPVLSRKDIRVPFITCEEMLQADEAHGLDLWELAVRYECARGNLSPGQVLDRMGEIVRIMERSILAGIEGTEYADRILGYQSGSFRAQMEGQRLLDGGLLNTMILYVTAMMEVKSSMGLIVAAPTAGACGGLPGACIGAARAMGLSDEDMTRAMLAAGMIGVFIAAHATFAAEVGGCQAECGAGSGMAAAALVTLAGGSTRQAVAAASMALQNILGMICDPVANRVEVPCLGKNVMAASNALACANMALADYDPVIPLDEVIDTMAQVGPSLPHELRCTALGGLSITPASKEIEKRLGSPGATEASGFEERGPACQT
jgi:L-serine dehydratase